MFFFFCTILFSVNAVYGQHSDLGNLEEAERLLDKYRYAEVERAYLLVSPIYNRGDLYFYRAKELMDRIRLYRDSRNTSIFVERIAPIIIAANGVTEEVLIDILSEIEAIAQEMREGVVLSEDAIQAFANRLTERLTEEINREGINLNEATKEYLVNRISERVIYFLKPIEPAPQPPTPSSNFARSLVPGLIQNDQDRSVGNALLTLTIVSGTFALGSGIAILCNHSRFNSAENCDDKERFADRHNTAIRVFEISLLCLAAVYLWHVLDNIVPRNGRRQDRDKSYLRLTPHTNGITLTLNF